MVAGLVLTLAEPVVDEALLRLAEADRSITLGERDGARLPLVLEAGDRQTCEELHERIAETPGVALVRVAYVAFDDEEVPS